MFNSGGGGGLYIASNNALTSLSGLDSITSVGEDLAITYNPALPTALAEALVATIGTENIGGDITISNNNDDWANWFKPFPNINTAQKSCAILSSNDKVQLQPYHWKYI